MDKTTPAFGRLPFSQSKTYVSDLCYRHGMQNRLTLLIAEDDYAQRRLLELQLSDYDLIMSLDGRVALEYLADYQPDAMLLDITMPFVNGIDICRHAKNKSHLKDIPVIIMTSLIDELTRRAAEQAQADAVMEKPVMPSVLEETLSNLL